VTSSSTCLTCLASDII